MDEYQRLVLLNQRAILKALADLLWGRRPQEAQDKANRAINKIDDYLREHE